MNKSLYGGLALFVAAACFNACSPDDNAVGAGENATTGFNKAPAPTPANPAICFVDTYTSKGKTQQAIAVVDADGSHYARVYNSGATWLSWSPDGSQLCFLAGDTLYRLNVSLDSKGVPVGSNLTALYGGSVAGGNVWEPMWSPAGSEIAFASVKDGTVRLMLVSSNGGTPTVLYSDSGNTVRYVTWSSDGSKIAFASNDLSTQTHSIKVVSRSTGALLNTYIAGDSEAIAYRLDWSRSGLNKILFRAHDAAGANKLFTIDCSQSDPSAVAVAIPSADQPLCGAWSPDNSKIVYSTGSALRTVTVSTGATVTIAGYSSQWIDWKR